MIVTKRNNKKEKFATAGEYTSTGFVVGTASLFGEGVNYINEVTQISKKIVGSFLTRVSVTFLFIGSAIGIGTGYYFTNEHCKDLIDKLYNYFLKNIKTLSLSLIIGVEYLEVRAKLSKE